ncbi:MAG: TetR/AcrR family transcriptional regulator [Lachnospiraceae bacterium]|nr:TetR/AcrR family transcriptional regulator [Lachnospiraceae bacterium]
MAKQIEGVYERILECAKYEFLEKGFKDASLRVIAANAKTSTSSIYTRFKDKEGLFREIVEPVVEEMKRRFFVIQEDFHQLDDEKQPKIMKEYTYQGVQQMIAYIYEHFDEFQLLLDASYGTKYQNFVDDLTRIEVEYTYKYMKVIGCESIRSGMVTEKFLHIITTAYFESLFEIVRHNMSREEADKYIQMLEKYHMAGFDTIFNPEKYSL